MAISDELRAAVRVSRQRQYHLAQLIGIHPATLSAWMNDIFAVKDADPRVIKLGELVGIPASRCFRPPTIAPVGDTTTPEESA